MSQVQNYTLHKFNSIDEMVDTLKESLESKFEQQLLDQGNFSWAVSGGSTPRALFQSFANSTINWSKANIALVDERWVPPTHERSNEKFIQATLLQEPVAAASFTGMYTNLKSSAEDCVGIVEENYTKIKGPFSSVLLGLGPDGHTASLFPNALGLEAAFKPNNPARVAAVTAIKSVVTGQETERMTLTAAEICRAKHVCLLITGQEKLDSLLTAFEDRSNLPIARLCSMLEIPLEVYWAP